MGLLLTTIGIIKKNSFLITSMFCALFLIEGIWLVSFFSYPLVHRNLTPLAAYAFLPNYPKFEFYTTFYHILILPSLIIALVATKKVHSLGFLGSAAFASVLILLSLWFVPKGDNVNCVQGPCSIMFTKLYNFPRLISIPLAVSALTIFVYFPLNLFAQKFVQKLSSRKMSSRE